MSWKIKELLDTIGREIESSKGNVEQSLAEHPASCWPAFT